MTAVAAPVKRKHLEQGMKVVSLFTGIGGFDLAFARVGADVVLQSENEPHCQKVLAERFDIPLVPDVRDVRNIGRGIDCVVGGFPCQDLSVAGKRGGLDGERSGLWFEYRRILEEVRPRWFIVENVPGLLSSNDGRDMGTVLGALADLGYGYSYRVLDAQWFGLPQRRKRVFIVGCLGDAARAAQVLLEPESGGGRPETWKEARTIASALTRNGVGGGGGADDNAAQSDHLVAGTMMARGTAGGYPGTQEALDGHLVTAFRKTKRACDDADGEGGEAADVANTLDAGGNSTRTSHAIAFHPIQDPIPSEVSPALGAKSGDMGLSDETGVRRLTPLECERLQGFPDGWTSGHSDTQRYRMLGNAVAVPVVEWIAHRMMAAL